MFDWLRRVFQRSDANERQQFFELCDALNAEEGGGKPVAVKKTLGRLKLRSGTLLLGDPQYLPDLEFPSIGAPEVEISASLWQYPSGAVTVTALQLGLGEATVTENCRKVGDFGIDSAKFVLVDKGDFEEYWADIGKDRIGVIHTAPNDTVLRLLTKRFKLKTIRVNSFRAEVVGPVSEDLGAEIEAFLKADPKYADYPFMHFCVQTNSSFDRANFMKGAWEFMPVGNSPGPLMFVCSTGRGDGCYEVQGEFAGESLRKLTIDFIED